MCVSVCKIKNTIYLLLDIVLNISNRTTHKV